MLTDEVVCEILAATVTPPPGSLWAAGVAHWSSRRSSSAGLSARPPGAPPGQDLRSGALIGQGEPWPNKIRITRVSTAPGEPRNPADPAPRSCPAARSGRSSRNVEDNSLQGCRSQELRVVHGRGGKVKPGARPGTRESRRIRAVPLRAGGWLALTRSRPWAADAAPHHARPESVVR